MGLEIMPFVRSIQFCWYNCPHIILYSSVLYSSLFLSNKGKRSYIAVMWLVVVPISSPKLFWLASTSNSSVMIFFSAFLWAHIIAGKSLVFSRRTLLSVVINASPNALHSFLWSQTISSSFRLYGTSIADFHHTCTDFIHHVGGYVLVVTSSKSLPTMLDTVLSYIRLYLEFHR